LPFNRNSNYGSQPNYYRTRVVTPNKPLVFTEGQFWIAFLTLESFRKRRIFLHSSKLPPAVEQLERRLIEEALRESGENKQKAAQVSA
jgi:Bacterial regulatory protein, Fis family